VRGRRYADGIENAKVEYAALTALKKRLADLGVKVKKSEIVRAGLALVAVLDDENLQALRAKVPPLG